MSTFTVTNTSNSGAGSLRQAVLNANTLTGKDIINFGGLFSDGLAHTISLTGSGLSIIDDLTIEGINASKLTIKDDSVSRVFDIAKGVISAINGLTITNTYNGAGGGGAISNVGVLTLSNSIITGNTVNNNVTDSDGKTSSYGGAIYNTGSLTVDYSSITGNSVGYNITGNSSIDREGGGIFNQGSLTVKHTTISYNNSNDGGGGIYSDGTITLNNSTISGNSADFEGGGIYASGTITVNNTSITSNTAAKGDGGGIYQLGNGNLLVNNSTISTNKASAGGAILGGYTGTITVNNSLINANSGGGIYIDNEYSLTVNNSTISSNTTNGNGGGIYAPDGSDGSVTSIKNSVITNNTAMQGGGISTNIDLIVSNSIISGNKATYQGGGIYDDGGGIPSSPSTGNIIVTNSQINDNSTEAQGYGGGIYNVTDSAAYGPNGISATITVSHSTINGNNSYYGGGIYDYGILSVSHSTISGNTAIKGGGIYNPGEFILGYRGPDELHYGTLTVTNSTISHNNASDGGGIYNNGIVSVSNSTISHNYATNYGGGIYNSSSDGNRFTDSKLGIVTVTNSNIIYNTAVTAGGGIYNDKDTDFGSSVLNGYGTFAYTLNGLGIVTVNHSTISGNQAHFGGGIYNDGTLTVGNSIIRHNKAFGIELSSGAEESGKGGGIYNSDSSYATATIDYSTVACNFDTSQEDSNTFIKLDNLIGKFITKGSFMRV
ncbi:MAG: right-handed parallel beta-helix repeat-containing protein [Nostoc sp. NMS7]|uniref:beta strand repeat-containing protein n=1 Tax=Nostoc sp. NMS7 TaxID=2815391 RepID=UPI0025EE89D6|nr:right-handed parallel beta-helix repeat-containing protein [Nostoc sp. NMS7]MBN3950895.1 right-handed parallel beta-helix repeat-containing protein [Nostoc sp. NMS7]